MTGYTVHTGASKKFVEGWDAIFGSQKEKKKTSGSRKKKQSVTKTKAQKRSSNKSKAKNGKK